MANNDGVQPQRCIVCEGDCRYLFPKRGFEIWRCTSCGLGTVHPMPTPEELSRFYADDYYDTSEEIGYHTAYHELEAGLLRTYRQLLDKVERRRPGKRFERVLDVGCAYGYFLDAVEERWSPKEIVGVDISPEARERAAARGRTFHAGFVEEVELPDAHFDLVYMGDAFEHVHDPLVVADKLARVLAPDGVLMVTTLDFGSWLARILRSHWRLLTPPEHLFFWTRQSMGRIFADCGLTPEISSYWLYYPKAYVYQRTRGQFGFTPRLLGLLPGDLVAVPSFDAMVGLFLKPS